MYKILMILFLFYYQSEAKYVEGVLKTKEVNYK